MKIHLIFAPPVKMPKFGELSEGRIPPLGIMYIAAYLRERVQDVDIKITDGLLIGFERTLQEAEKQVSFGWTLYSVRDLPSLDHRQVKLDRASRGPRFLCLSADG